MVAKWSGVLSTTEPRNDIGVLNVRQGNINSETVEFMIIQNNKPYNLTGLKVDFCANFGLSAVQKSAVVKDAVNGKIEFTFNDPTMQAVGRKLGYFQISKVGSLIDSTQDFEYRIQDSILSRKMQGGSYIESFENILETLGDNAAVGLANDINRLEDKTTAQLAKTVGEVQKLDIEKAPLSDLEAFQTQLDNIVASAGNPEAVSAEILQAHGIFTTLAKRFEANENGDNLQLNNKEFKKIMINSDNILDDVFLDKAIPNDARTTVQNSSNGSNIIHLSNIGAETSFNIPFTYFKSQIVNETTIYLNFKAKTQKNEFTGLTSPALSFYQYLGTSLKGAKTQNLTFGDDFIQYSLPMKFDAGSSWFDRFKVINLKPSEIYFKDFYITFTQETEGYNVIDEIIKESTMKEKLKTTVIGDSLSDETVEPFSKYPKHLRETGNYEITNLSKSGSGYFNPSSHQTQFYNQALSVPSDTDVAFVFGSFNDMSRLFNGEVTMGTITDTGTNTIYGCINKTIDNIYSIDPSITVCLATPTPWQGMNEKMDESNPYFNFVHDYIDALFAVAEKRHIDILDLFHNSGLRPWDAEFRQLYYQNSDGTHPNTNGQLKFLYPQIREFLNTKNYHM